MTRIQTHSHNLSLKQRWLVLASVMFVMTALMAGPAMAQALDPVVRASTIIRDTVVAVALLILTAAWGIAGYKMAFTGSAFREVVGNIIGGAIAGGAAILAAVFVQ
jgi:TrbC/VIRB2 pilin